MTTAAQLVGDLKQLVSQAKAVPMSASCMVNRAEVLGLLDGVLAHIEAERDVATPKALEEAERIRAEARDEAARLTGEDEVHRAAVAEAERLAETSQAEAEALRKEADAYVDQRMAALEAGLSKQLSQVSVLRARLSQRSGLDDPLDD